jgi:CheY-like chemotaxis protein
MAKQYRALVVDDDEDARDILSMFLQSRGFVTAMAINGRDALEKIGPFTPNIVITDIAMPVMDGWSFLERKWSDMKIARIPVIVVSASVDMVPRPYPYEIVPKPVDLMLLSGKIDSVLKAA